MAEAEEMHNWHTMRVSKRGALYNKTTGPLMAYGMKAMATSDEGRRWHGIVHVKNANEFVNAKIRMRNTMYCGSMGNPKSGRLQRLRSQRWQVASLQLWWLNNGQK